MIERGENNYFVQDLKFVLLCCSCSWEICVLFVFEGGMYTLLQFIYYGVCWVLVAARGLSQVVASSSYSLLGVLRLLIAVASLVGEHRM